MTYQLQPLTINCGLGTLTLESQWGWNKELFPNRIRQWSIQMEVARPLNYAGKRLAGCIGVLEHERLADGTVLYHIRTPKGTVKHGTGIDTYEKAVEWIERLGHPAISESFRDGVLHPL